ncbi:MAG: hypothetical protein ACRD3G_15240 [Vicinamibacterales bacterium]
MFAATDDGGWRTFLDELRSDILPLYRRHERSFDTRQAHGRMHICRSVIFAEFMCRYVVRIAGLRPCHNDVRYAVAFHDAGRRGNGPDRWEDESRRLCEAYLSARTGRTSPAAVVGNLIASKATPVGVEARIVHDADVLEIMRPCSGNGARAGFRAEHLYFGSARDAACERTSGIRGRLIEEAWAFISASEPQKGRLDGSSDYFHDVLSLLAAARDRCPLLAAPLLDVTNVVASP